MTIAINLPGPAAAFRLSALGATVTKVESPAGDFLAHGFRRYYDELLGEQVVVTLDLKSPEGLAELQDLLGEAEVLITSRRTSALRRLASAGRSCTPATRAYHRSPSPGIRRRTTTGRATTSPPRPSTASLPGAR